MKTRATHFVLAIIATLGVQHVADAQTMRLSIKRVWGATPASTSTTASPALDWNAPITANPPDRITQMVTDANTILGTAGINLVMIEPVVDLVDPGYPFSFYDVDLSASGTKKHALEAACEIDPARFAYRPNAINVYLVNSITDPGGPIPTFGGTSSFPYGVGNTSFNDEDDLIFISSITGQILPGNPNPAPTRSSDYFAATLAHEVGHYFGLLHTYEQTLTSPEFFACSSLPCSASTAGVGDEVADTPADAATYASMFSTYGIVCPGSQAFFADRLLKNPMASHYTDFTIPTNFPGTALPTAATMYFTCGQGARMAFYANTQRSRVQVGPVAPPSISGVTINNTTSNSIDYIAQAAPMSLKLSGTNLPNPNAAVPIDVTVGRIKKLASSLTFVPELRATSMSTTNAGNEIIAAFPAGAVLPPGRHTVCVRTATTTSTPSQFNFQTVASKDNAVEVTPWVDVVSLGASPVAEPYLLEFKAAQPIYGWIGIETPALPSYPTGVLIPPVPYELLVNLANTQLQMFNLPSTMHALMGFDTSPFGAAVVDGLRVNLQYAQFDPSTNLPIALSNVIEYVVP